MFQQGGDREVRAETRSEEHLSSKSVRELKAELDAIFEKEECVGVEADCELIARHIAAIEKKEAEEHSQVRPHDNFERSWAHFTKNHPDLFPPKKTKPRDWSKRMGRTVEAAILAATILIVTAAALNLPDHIVEWGKELLRISPPPSGVMELTEPSTNGYSTLAEAVVGAGIDDANTPTWIPARFSIRDLAIQELPSYTMVIGVYEAAESELVIRITRYSEVEDMPYFNLEINDDSKQEDVIKDGITYHYTENFGVLRVTWKSRHCLYGISGEISREEMDRMVNSFYGG